MRHFRNFFGIYSVLSIAIPSCFAIHYIAKHSPAVGVAIAIPAIGFAYIELTRCLATMKRYHAGQKGWFKKYMHTFFATDSAKFFGTFALVFFAVILIKLIF